MLIATGDTSSFRLFAVPHVVAIVLTWVVPVCLAVLVRKVNSPRLTRIICWALAGILVGNELSSRVYGLCVEPLDFFLKEYLPIHICGLAVFLTAAMLVQRGQFIFELVYFLGLGGTFQAILTPNIEGGFPSYGFIQFFIAHCTIVVGVLFAVWGLRMRPRPRSILWTFLFGNAYMVLIAGINWLLDANYMFLCHPPKGASPFFFVPWPWYILALQPIALAIFGVLYAPFPLADLIRRRRRQPAAESAPGQREDPSRDRPDRPAD